MQVMAHRDLYVYDVSLTFCSIYNVLPNQGKRHHLQFQVCDDLFFNILFYFREQDFDNFNEKLYEHNFFWRLPLT